MTTLAEAFVRLRPDVSRTGPEIEQALVGPARAGGEHAGKAAGEGFGSGFKSTVKALAAGVAGLELFNFLRESVTAGREAQQALRLTEAVVKSTGGAAHVSAEQVHSLAEKLGELDGVQADVVQSGENVLLTFTNVRNRVGGANDIFNQATQAALNLSAGMHEDLQPAVVQIGKALNDPIKGMTALGRVGVTFSAAQKEQIKTMVEHNNLLGAQKVILGELSKEFGGAAAAATDPAQKGQVAWHDFKEELGNKLLPVVNNVVKALTPMLPLIAAIVGQVVDFITHNRLLVEILGGVAAAIWLVNFALDANPISLIILGIVGLIIVFTTLWEKSTGFKNAILEAWHGIRVAITSVANFFTRQIPEAWSYVYEHAMRIWSQIVNFLSDKWYAIVAGARRVADFFTKDIPAAWDEFWAKTKEKFDQVKKGVTDKLTDVINFFRDLPGKILHALGDLGRLLWNAGIKIITGLWEGLKHAWHDVEDWFGGIGDWISAHKGPIEVDARLLIPHGLAIMQGLQTGLSSGMPGLNRTVGSITNSVVTTTAAAPLPVGRGDQVETLLRRIADLLAGLNLKVGPEGLALAVRRGERSLTYAGA